MKIADIKGFELMDSRGNPTVGAKVILQNGVEGFAISPSGASTGNYEAYELRDLDNNRYGGKGTKKAVENISGKIRRVLIGTDIFSQREIDFKMVLADGSSDKSNLGANAILAVSLACAKAAANALKIPLYKYIGGITAQTLPRPMMNILNGGVHAANNIDIQEFMIVPVCYESFSDCLQKCAEIYHSLGKILKEENLSCGVGDEGGFAPSLSSDEYALDLIVKAIEKAGYTTDQINIALDVASSEWYDGEKYHLPKRNTDLSADELIMYYEKLIQKYPIISLEDGMAEDDYAGWKKLTEILGDKIQLVGDDLFVTNTSKFLQGVEKKAANAILIKPNQIGSLTETLDVIKLAKENGYSVVVSHRSGESEDTTISDLAVGVNSGQIKTGAPCRSDRTSKYNRLLIIEDELKNIDLTTKLY